MVITVRGKPSFTEMWDRCPRPIEQFVRLGPDCAAAGVDQENAWSIHAQLRREARRRYHEFVPEETEVLIAKQFSRWLYDIVLEVMIRMQEKPIKQRLKPKVYPQNCIDDIFQEASKKAYLNFDQFRPEESARDVDRQFHDWMFRIADNLSIDNYRRIKRRPAETPIDRNIQVVENKRDPQPSPDEQAIVYIMAERVLDALSPRDQDVILERAIEGWSDENELAERLGAPTVQALDQRHRRALRRYEDLLKQQLYPDNE